VAKQVLAKGRHLQLVSEDGWEFIERVGVSGVVAVLAVTKDGRLVLTEQYRKPVQAQVLDLPAGLAGDEDGQEDEPLAEAAQRELLEETGYRASKLRELTSGPSSAGLSSEIITFFEALDVEKVESGGGVAGENICVHEVPLSELCDWLQTQQQQGKLVDPKIFAALYLAQCDSKDNQS